MKFRGIAVAAIIALSFPLQSVAEEDPFPGVEYQAEIPGTRIESSPGATNDEWNNSEAMRNHTCPEGSGRAIGVDLRGTATSTDNIRFAYCIKTWRSQSVIDAWDQYYRDLRAAEDAAADESRRWNEANPGKQKCVQWGPITSPDGGQSSGGVCANPVPVGMKSVIKRLLLVKEIFLVEARHHLLRVLQLLIPHHHHLNLHQPKVLQQLQRLPALPSHRELRLIQLLLVVLTIEEMDIHLHTLLKVKLVLLDAQLDSKLPMD